MIIPASGKEINDLYYLRLLPVIHAIAECARNKDRRLEDYLYESNLQKPKSDKSVLLKKKRKNSGIEADFKEIQNILGVKEGNDNKEGETESEKDEGVAAVEECVDVLSEHFKDKTKEEVIESLKKTSMDIEKSYLINCDTDAFKGN